MPVHQISKNLKAWYCTFAVSKQAFSYIAIVNAKWYIPMKENLAFLQMHLSIYLAISLLEIYPEVIPPIILKYICTVFITVLLIIRKY